MHALTFKSSTTLAAIAIFTAGSSAQSTSTSSFDFDSAISAADTATSSFDLYTTNGSLGPGVLDTSSRFGLYTTATPVVGPIGNGTAANGTLANGTTTTTTGGGGSGTTGGVGGGSGDGASSSGGSSGSADSSAPAATGNVAASAGELWVEGAGVLVGIGAVMVAL